MKYLITPINVGSGDGFATLFTYDEEAYNGATTRKVLGKGYHESYFKMKSVTTVAYLEKSFSYISHGDFIEFEFDVKNEDVASGYINIVLYRRTQSSATNGILVSYAAPVTNEFKKVKFKMPVVGSDIDNGVIFNIRNPVLSSSAIVKNLNITTLTNSNKEGCEKVLIANKACDFKQLYDQRIKTKFDYSVCEQRFNEGVLKFENGTMVIKNEDLVSKRGFVGLAFPVFPQNKNGLIAVSLKYRNTYPSGRVNIIRDGKNSITTLKQADKDTVATIYFQAAPTSENIVIEVGPMIETSHTGEFVLNELIVYQSPDNYAIKNDNAEFLTLNGKLDK